MMKTGAAELPRMPSTAIQLGTLLTALGRFPLPLFQLLFRICAGGVFWYSGLTKTANWQLTVLLFRDEYRVPVISPEIAATLATTVELSMPVLLLLGFATRLATLPLLAMTFVIEAFVYPQAWLEHLTWATMLLFILTRGPGMLSVDHLIARKFLHTEASTHKGSA